MVLRASLSGPVGGPCKCRPASSIRCGTRAPWAVAVIVHGRPAWCLRRPSDRALAAPAASAETSYVCSQVDGGSTAASTKTKSEGSRSDHALRHRTLLAAAAGSLWPLAGPALGQAPLPAWQGLRLQDHRLQPVSAAQLQGRPLLLHFVFAGCSSVCPLQLQELVQLHEGLAPAVRASVQFVSVTVDPLTDTTQSLAAFARRHGADRPGWRFVSGAPAEVHRLLDRMQVFDPAQPAPRPDDHRSALWLYTAEGTLLQRFRGAPVDRSRLADELTRLSRPPGLARTPRSPA
jgi:protein SCO1/2